MGQLNTKSRIASRALHLVGEAAIVSLTDVNPQANACALHFDAARDTALERMRPNFAKAFFTLNAVTPSPTLKWAYQYTLPPDYIAMVETIPSDLLYQVIGTSLYADESGVSIIYVKREEDTAKWTPLFADAMVYKLAALIAPIFKSDFGIAQQYEAAFEKAILQAAIREAQEDPPVELMNDDLLIVRSVNN